MNTTDRKNPWPIEKDGKVIGVGIPIINKAIYFSQVRLGLAWNEAKAHAKEVGGELPSKKQLYIIAYFYDELREIWPDIAKDCIWGEEYSGTYAWALLYLGAMYSRNKYNRMYAVPLADLILDTQTLDTETQEESAEDLAISTTCDGDKLIEAGFLVIREDDNPSPRIKQMVSRGSGSCSWVTYEKFSTKAARNRRFAQLLKVKNVIKG